MAFSRRYASKKELIESFIVVEQYDLEREIKTSNCFAVTYKFKDGTFDLDVKVDLQDDENTKYLLVDIHLTNLLGELKYMEKVKRVSIVDEFENGVDKKGIPIGHLKDII